MAKRVVGKTLGTIVLDDIIISAKKLDLTLSIQLVSGEVYRGDVDGMAYLGNDIAIYLKTQTTPGGGSPRIEEIHHFIKLCHVATIGIGCEKGQLDDLRE